MKLVERLHNGYAYYGPYADAVEADAYEAADEIERLQKELTIKDGQIVMLREVLEKVRGHGRLYNLFSCVGSDSYDPECADLNAQKCRELAEEALAATNDLKEQGK